MLQAASADTKKATARGNSQPPAAPAALQAPPVPVLGNQAALRLMRKCDCGGAPDCDCDMGDDKKKKEKDSPRAALHRAASEHGGPDIAPPIVHDVLRSAGEMLDAETLAFFESRFRRDFSGVRIHTDSRAAQSARAVHAHAYTVGNDIAFASGRFAPSTGDGRLLLAHELAHTTQQSGAATVTSEPVTIDQSDSAEERRAVETTRALPVESARTAVTPARANMRQSPAMYQTRLSRQADGTAQKVYICAKDLETSPVGRHSFFRVGGAASGNPTFELEPQDNRPVRWIDGDKHHSGCWQGVPMRDVSEDKSYVASTGDCQETTISVDCLQQQFASYPVGRYCTFGPNSNSFVGYIAKQCGVPNPSPSGWTPGIDVAPPESGSFAPSTMTTMLGCDSETGCGIAVAAEQATTQETQRPSS